MKITNYFFIASVIFLFFPLISVFAQKDGETIFKETCAVCHTIGKGKTIGPDLANIQTRLPEEWITRFIRSSQTVIRSGDKYADSLFKAYNQIPMPDQPNLTDAEIKGLLAYIAEKSATPDTTTVSAAALAGNSERGRELFVGSIRFANQGAACNACHNVDMKGLISGGALAIDLTHTVSRLSAAGVGAIIAGLPFPQMKETYNSKPVTPQETADIVAFLTLADKQEVAAATSPFGNYLLLGGLGGIIILLVLYSVFWFKRKKEPVNFFIFNRQMKSV